jgi:hypothetical protein
LSFLKPWSFFNPESVILAPESFGSRKSLTSWSAAIPPSVFESMRANGSFGDSASERGQDNRREIRDS